jgi:hypothetical protein
LQESFRIDPAEKAGFPPAPAQWAARRLFALPRKQQRVPVAAGRPESGNLHRTICDSGDIFLRARRQFGQGPQHRQD